MADIVRTRVETTEQNYRRNGGGAPVVTVRERVVVRSIRANRIDVSVVRDFAAALDEAGVDGRAIITCQHSDPGHLVQLVAQHEDQVDQPEVSDPAQASALEATSSETPATGAS